MSFFPLPHYCDIQRKTTTRQTSGQLTETWSTVANGVKCLFYSPSGGFRTDTHETHDQIPLCYFEFSTDIREGDRIVNVKTKTGLLESGPYLTASLKRVTTLRGKGHHITAKLKGDA